MSNDTVATAFQLRVVWPIPHSSSCLRLHPLLFRIPRLPVQRNPGAQFLHDLGNLRDPGAEQHIHFVIGGLNILEVNQLQTWSQFANRVRGIVTTGREVSDVGGGSDRGGKSLEDNQNVVRALIDEFLAFEVVIVNSEG